MGSILSFRFNCPEDHCAYASDLLAAWPEVLAVTVHYEKEGPPEIAVPIAVEVFTQNSAFGEQLRAVLYQDSVLPFGPSEQPEAVALEIERTLIEEADWAEAWKQYWHVDAITQRLTICPSWEEYTPQRLGEIVLTLDPGMAFGTGTHPSTRLMLEQVEALVHHNEFGPRCPERPRMIDLGCGSGILALAAAKLGYSAIDALDIDPNAVKATRANAEINEVSERINVSGIALEQWPKEPLWDVWLVNILAPVIQLLLPEITLRAKPGAVLLASGLIRNQVEPLQAHFQHHGWRLEGVYYQDDWAVMQLRYELLPSAA